MMTIWSKYPERTLGTDVPYGREHRALCAKRTYSPRVFRFSRNGSQG